MSSHSETAVRKVLILGLGNILFQDEGLGVRAAECLQACNSIPEDVQVLDGGTLGLSLLPFLDDVTHLLILDTVDAGQPPGTLVRLEGKAIPVALSHKLSMHQVGLQELLVAGSLTGSLPENIVLWGVQPETIDWGLGLTNPVENALEQLVDSVLNELANLGI